MVEMSDNGDTGGNKYSYTEYLNRILVQEQPFYRNGMTEEEIHRELVYLNNHLDSFYQGEYVPLWKQNLI